MRSRFSRIGLAAVAAGLVSPAHAAAPAGAPCDVVAFSPDFATDGTALCGHQHVDAGGIQRSLEIWATTDGGRSWAKKAGAGLPTSFTQDRQGPSLVDIEFSPHYAADRLVHVAVTDQGIYSTADLGLTFRHFSPLLDMARPPWSDVLTPLGAGFLYRDIASTALVAPPVSTAIEGPEGETLKYLVPPDWPASPVLVAHVVDRGEEDFGATLSECDAKLACHTERHIFGPREFPLDMWYGGDARTLYLYLIAIDPSYRTFSLSLQKSTDSGRTFKRWGAADALLRQIDPDVTPTLPAVSFAVDPARPATIDLRISYGLSRVTRPVPFINSSLAPPSPPHPPGEQVFRTTDGGTRWTRTGYALAWGQHGRKGTLPWTGMSGFGHAASGIWNPGGGRLFAISALDGRTRTEYAGIWCSADGGKKWARTCPK